MRVGLIISAGAVLLRSSNAWVGISASSRGGIRYTAGFHSSPALLMAKPKRGSVVDSYRSVDIMCTCRAKLFTYKKKNGTKSNLVKMYRERIVEDYFGLFADSKEGEALVESDCTCPKCGVIWGRPATVKGLPAIKIVGNRVRMK